MKKVLVVDDSAMNLRVVKDILEDDYQVIPVLSGGTAISFLQNHMADLILLDVYMPEKDGIETLKEIQKEKRLMDIPVVFLSASLDEAIINQCEKLGAKAFIQKPFFAKQVKNTIRQILEKEEENDGQEKNRTDQ